MDRCLTDGVALCQEAVLLMLGCNTTPCAPTPIHHPIPPGNSLFHVVVESDDVAMRCSELLVQYKLGRVSFMPLNTLNPSEVGASSGVHAAQHSQSLS